jgi:GNAT superfamily N-acetyltransferase
MLSVATTADAKPLPHGYRIEFHQAGPVTRACIIAPDGALAASGCAAETPDVFIYDRIETAQDHRRKGLGAAVMTALGTARKYAAGPQLLVATEDGRHLYGNLGWTVLAPFSAVSIPER